MFCIHCGATLRPSQAFCIECGTPRSAGPGRDVHSQSTTTPQHTSSDDDVEDPVGVIPTRRRGRGAVAAGVTALSVAAVVVGILLVAHQNRTPPPMAAPVTTVVVTTIAPAPAGSTIASGTPTQVTVPPATAPVLSPAGIDLSAVVTNPLAASVSRTLDTYFTGINSHDGAAAAAAFDPTGAINPNDADQVAQFDAQIATTYDDQIVVHDIGPDPAASGGYLVAVTFRSHQAPSAGPGNDEACTNWALSYTMTSTLKLLRSVGTVHIAC